MERSGSGGESVDISSSKSAGLKSGGVKPTEKDARQGSGSAALAANPWTMRIAIVCFIILNLILGLFSQPIVRAITDGLAMFG